MCKRGEIAPKEQFLLFSTLFYIYISNFRSQITYSFVKITLVSKLQEKLAVNCSPDKDYKER